MADRDPAFSYLVDVVDSIATSGLADDLAGSTSMHDLMVVPRPIQNPR